MVINNIDIYQAFGVRPTQGAYNDLVNFPSLKAVESNDWFEEDGIEVDLSDPKIDSQKVVIPFYCDRGNEAIYNFIEYISQSPFNCYFNGLYREYKLRLINNTNLSQLRNLGTFKLDFSIDNPFYNNNANVLFYLGSSASFNIDIADISSYGLKVLDGALNNILKVPSIKEPLIIKNKAQNGAIVDIYNNGKFKSKEVNIPFLMRTNTLADFWNKHDALLKKLISPNERELFIPELQRTFRTYYKSCKTNNFRISSGGDVWWNFTLTFVFINFSVSEYDNI